MKRFLSTSLALLLIAVSICGCSVELSPEGLNALESMINDFNQHLEEPSDVSETASVALTVDENGIYDQKDEVALYINTYGKLPRNYLTKEAARLLGWNGGSVNEIIPNGCIGGDSFGNYEEKLPEKVGRSYFECDINTLKKDDRGDERIVYSNDGLIYYTDDHYESFELLYGNEE